MFVKKGGAKGHRKTVSGKAKTVEENESGGKGALPKKILKPNPDKLLRRAPLDDLRILKNKFFADSVNPEHFKAVNGCLMDAMADLKSLEPQLVKDIHNAFKYGGDARATRKWGTAKMSLNILKQTMEAMTGGDSMAVFANAVLFLCPVL